MLSHRFLQFLNFVISKLIRMRYRFLNADKVKDDAISGACSRLCEIRSGTFLYGNSNM